jgi:putative acetyltransferase
MPGGHRAIVRRPRWISWSALIERGLLVEDRRMPVDATVRRTTEDDRAAVRRTVREAFSGEAGGGQEEVEIVEAVWTLEAPSPTGDLVAVAGGMVVGHVLASLGTLDGLAVPGIAPLAVRPGWQRRGIGTALVTDLLHRLGQQGFPLVVVLGDPDYYRRFGFQPAGTLDIHYLPVGADNPHFQVLRLGDHDAPSGDYVYRWEASVG